MGQAWSPVLRHAVVDGASIPFLELGDPHGPPLVLVPGLGDGLAPITHAATREALAAAPLPLTHLRGIVVSHPSSGHVPSSTQRLATALAAVLDVVLDEPAVVVGHSLGSMVALHLAAERPDLARALVLSAGSAHADGALAALLARWDRLLRAEAFGAFARDVVEHSFTGTAVTDRRRLVDAVEPPDPPRHLVARHLALSSACADHDARDRLQAVMQPVLVLAGASDAVIPAEHSRRLAAELPDARLQVFADLGHGFPEQAPDRYDHHVRPFIEAVVG